MKGHRRKTVRAPALHGSALRWIALFTIALVVVAIFLAASTWRQSVALEPLPTVSQNGADPAVASILEKARQLVEQDPRSSITWGDLGAVLRAHEFGPEAEVCFRNAQRLDPDDYRWPYLLAVSLAAVDADQALVHLRRAAQLAGDRAHVQLRFAEALLSCNLLDEAKAAIDRALQIAPDDPRAQLAMAQWLFAKEQFAESRRWCERSLMAAPDKRAGHLLLAQLCRRLGDAKGATRELEILASIPEGITEWEDPDVANVLALRQDRGWQLHVANELAAAGHEQEATQLLTEMARSIDPSGEVSDRLAQALLAQGRSTEAAALLRDKLVKNPSSERLRFRLGIALFGQEDYAGAASEFGRVVELKPDNIDAYYNLGHALRKAGRDSDAQEAFAAAVKLSPGHAFARANLAEMLLDAGQTKEARPHLEVAARLAPRDPKVRELLTRLESGP